jgi:AraC-like DNA-binding protein
MFDKLIYVNIVMNKGSAMMWNERLSFALNNSPGNGEIVVLFSGQERTLPNHHLGPQILDYYLVHYVLSGSGWCRAGDSRQMLGPGDAFFIFPDEISEYSSDALDPWHYCWVGFRGSLARSWVEKLGISVEQPIIRHTRRRPHEGLFRAIYSALKESGAPSDERAGAYFRLLLAEWLVEHPTYEEPLNHLTEVERQIDKAIRWFTLQYAQPKSIAQLAKELGYHRTHFAKMFRHYIGMSPQAYLIKVRLEKAKKLLKQPLTIEQVAFNVGFTDALYFSRQFKKYYGLSPTRYRNDNRE